MTGAAPPAATLDARGLLCPLPLVLATKRLRESEPGLVLAVLADDPAAPGDFESWARGGGGELLGIREKRGCGKPTWEIRVRR